MRLVAASLALAASVFFLVACSDSPDSLGHRGARSSADTGAASGANGGSSSSPAGGTPHASDAPAPVPTTTGSAVSGPPPAAGTCANPTCTVSDGTCGCKATDTDGNAVTMDCQDGVCTCTTGQDATTQFGDDGCASDADARTLYFANCGCL